MVLLDAGADPDALDLAGLHVLHDAANANAASVVPILVQRCRMLNPNTKGLTGTGLTPLDVAYKRTAALAADVLLREGGWPYDLLCHAAAARIQSIWRLRRQIRARLPVDEDFTVVFRPIARANLAVLRLHYRQQLLNRHAVFLAEARQLGRLPSQLEGTAATDSTSPVLAATSTSRSRTLSKSTGSMSLSRPERERREPSSHRKASSNGTLRAAPAPPSTARVISRNFVRPSTRQHRAASVSRATSSSRKLQAQLEQERQRNVTLQDQLKLLESVNRHQAKALEHVPAVNDNTEDSDTRRRSYSNSVEIKRFMHQRKLIDKYQRKIASVKARLDNSLVAESSPSMNADEEIKKAARQAARQQVKAALTDVRSIREKTEALAVSLKRSTASS
ncbi:uncharacterized protein MONBRDRAFT_5526 [Monosiga brevicollis MX1]|uniref:Uncharacterized protein n=1 Tax=Monosiga brevicollis TaxID=81824 RepID=A9URQ2_MONBE|nr:uncharacterized protein MONBRDRAFT_5526 [Monosiga brevicollis MX1]EDQ91645.1 predicted protein [Monosiga brevicollis MX1]|eukprot:XP_001742931.1 hypothetical protein [Monosiga brevicollis MX1]